MNAAKKALDFIENNPEDFDEILNQFHEEEYTDEDKEHKLISSKDLIEGRIVYYSFYKEAIASKDGTNGVRTTVVIYKIINHFTYETIKDEEEVNRIRSVINSRLIS